MIANPESQWFRVFSCPILLDLYCNLIIGRKKYRKKDPDKYKEAEYRVYDKSYKLIDTYTEGYKGYNGVYGDYPIYYGPLGVGDTSYFVKLDMDNGTAELYGGSKSKIGQLNGSQFKREKLATIKQSPAARYWIKSQNGVSRIW